MSGASFKFMTVFLGLCVWALFSIAGAQGEGNVLVNTDPQGALVRLEGDLSLSGVTPVKFDRPLSGRYEIKIIRDGFESHRSVAYFAEAQASELQIRLIPKTRTKSFFRSLILPGWGQKYYGNGAKATFFAMGTAAAALGYCFVRNDYDDKVEVYNALRTERDAATKWSEYKAIDLQVYEAQKEADDAEDWVNVLIAVTAGVYAFNLLDSFLLFPEYSSFTEYKVLTVKPQWDGRQVGLALALEF